jgi:uncharacterized membrane protein
MDSVEIEVVGIRRRLEAWRTEVRSSLWFTPTLLTIAYAVLAIVLVMIDRSLFSEEDGYADRLGLFRGGVDGARGVFSAIAGSLISATATVFSLTVVVLQLASNQFTPRLLRNFTSDRQFQMTLGILLGTFVYSLIALWSVGRDDLDREPFVPVIATLVAILLAMISVAVLILFIHRVSTLIQVSTILDRVSNDAVSLIRKAFDESDEEAGESERGLAEPLPDVRGQSVKSSKSGYIGNVDVGALLKIADEHALVLSVPKSVGTHVLPGLEIARFTPPGLLDEDVIAKIQRTVVIDRERGLVDDLTMHVRQIADIGAKALSPGINDPTTANICIDRLSEIIYHVAAREHPPIVRHGKSGGVVIFDDSPPIEGLIDEAFTQMRHYGAGDVFVSMHLATQLGHLAEVTPPGLTPLFADMARLVVASCENQGMLDADLERVRQAASWAEESSDDAPSWTTGAPEPES